jgi:hypothetical protein
MQKESDGRDAAEAACTNFACSFEHCFQQHKYRLVPPCEALQRAYERCVAEERDKRGLTGKKEKK